MKIFYENQKNYVKMSFDVAKEISHLKFDQNPKFNQTFSYNIFLNDEKVIKILKLIFNNKFQNFSKFQI